MKKLLILLCLISSFAYAQKISDLPAASTLGGTEVLAGVQAGTTKKISVNQLGTFMDGRYVPLDTLEAVFNIALIDSVYATASNFSVNSLFIAAGDTLSTLFQVQPAISGYSTEIGTIGNPRVSNTTIGNPISLAVQGSLLATTDQGSAKITVYADNSPDTLYVSMRADRTSNSDVQEFTMTPTHTYFKDSKAAKRGLQYAVADGSYVKTDSSLTNKAYVDSLVATVGGGGHVIEDEGTPLAQQTNLNFVGAGVAVTDAGGKTVVTISGTSLNFATRETPTGTINSSNVTFTLANTPTAGSDTVFLNGLLQTYTTDYTLATATITFVVAPTTGDILRVNYRY